MIHVMSLSDIRRKGEILQNQEVVTLEFMSAAHVNHVEILEVVL